jgi:hypothetical protein
MILRGTYKWNKRCENLRLEIEAFIQNWEYEQATRPLGAEALAVIAQ